MMCSVLLLNYSVVFIIFYICPFFNLFIRKASKNFGHLRLSYIWYDRVENLVLFVTLCKHYVYRVVCIERFTSNFTLRERTCRESTRRRIFHVIAGSLRADGKFVVP